MATLRKILVPFDFGPASQAALEQATLLASQFHAELTILHVCEVPAWAYDRIGRSPMPDATIAIEESARASLDEVVRRTTDRVPNDITVTAIIQHGSPWQRIDEVARTTGADLIVIGTHGVRGWLSHALIGSVAEKVVRSAPVPVLTVPAGSRSTPTNAI